MLDNMQASNYQHIQTYQVRHPKRGDNGERKHVGTVYAVPTRITTPKLIPVL